MECSFEGCTRTARGEYCRAHYQQKMKGKVLKPIQVQYHGLTEEARFLKRVIVGNQSECWPWTGSVMKIGWHGQWRNADGKIEPTHRAAWRLFKSQIPQGSHVLHRCDNPQCVRPEHLFVGTRHDNMQDMERKVRCRHPRGAEHGNAKLTDDQVREVMQLRKTGLSFAKIGELFGVRGSQIHMIAKGAAWRHVVLTR